MALDNTFTSAGFDSYVSLAEMNAEVVLLDGLYNISPYNELSDAKKENLAKYVTREMNMLEFRGGANSDIIAPDMKFPRAALNYRNGLVVDPDTIPDFVKRFISMRVIEVNDNQLKTKLSSEQQTQSMELPSLKKSFFEAKGSKPPSTLMSDLPSFLEISFYLAGNPNKIRVVR